MTLASILCAAFVAGATLFAQTIDIGTPPGTLIDIGGRRLHVYCTGSGSPGVILEAGAGGFAIDWALVQPEIARTNRVCSYDRAGSGWSDRAPAVETPAAVVADLHAALQAAGVTPPYVMVGASMSAIYVRIYDITYPGEVAGIVLVDPASEQRLFTMLDGKGGAQEQAFAQFQRGYNQERPHEALDYRTPATVYQASDRCYPRRTPELAYDDELDVRRISNKGALKWKGERTFISEVFTHEYLGLKAMDERWRQVLYGPVPVGWFDTHRHRFQRAAPRSLQEKTS